MVNGNGEIHGIHNLWLYMAIMLLLQAFPAVCKQTKTRCSLLILMQHHSPPTND